MHRRALLQTGAAAAAGLALPAVVRAQATRVLKFVPYTDLAVLDPIVTGNFAVRNHALMVFDTLYGVDDALVPQPQMVEGHVVGADGLSWTLRLREGLRFHDGTPVLGRDVVASLKRWGVRDLMGGMLMAATDELSAPDDRSVLFRLKTPFPLLPNALGKMVGNMAVIMPERLALTDAAKPVSEVMGSGPYRYLAAERLQGALNVYARNDAYVPRPNGTTSRMAGPKLAYFDRVEWHTMPDEATAGTALMKGEMDWWEQPSPDYAPVLRRRADIVVDILDPSGSYRYLHLNQLNPPFDKAAVRRAALAAVSQSDVLSAIAGTDEKMWRNHVGFFSPDSPMASDVGLAALRDPPDLAAATRMLKESGYAGETLAMVTLGTVPTLNATGLVVAEAWRKIGFNVDFQSVEIAAALQRLSNQGPVTKGGWSASPEGNSGATFGDPLLIAELNAIGRAGTFGWPDVPELATLRRDVLAAPDLAARQAIARRMQAVCFEQVPWLPCGITYQPTAYAKSLTGVLHGPPLFYHVRRG